MASQLERRLAALEAETVDRGAAYVWRNLGQTAEQAIAAEFPKGAPLGVAVTVIGWLESGSVSESAQAHGG
jgi:hypothetical protein